MGVDDDRGLRLVVWDDTGFGAARVQPLLTASWRVGSRLYRGHPQAPVDHAYGATSWADALGWLCAVRPERAIAEIQYWGHGLSGRVLIADDVLDAGSFGVGSPHLAPLRALRARLAPGALVWFRTCAAFGRPRGHAFACAAADFFGCRVAGHTYVIGPLQSGLHSLRPGERPSWSVDEGVPPGAWGAAHDPPRALSSSWSAPHTITCLHGAIPAGW